MERADWLKKMRLQTEAIYSRIAPAYWEDFGDYDNTTHLQFIEQFLARLQPHSRLLDAACGAGRYDGLLLEAGHLVLGVDQSGGMLARARQVFPADRYLDLQYEQTGLQELDFQSEFDGVLCIDALEHVCPEDWPAILVRLAQALKPGGVFYCTVEVAQESELRDAYERAQALGLPVVYGEMAPEIDSASTAAAEQDGSEIPGEPDDPPVYHYYPPLEQVRLWLDQAGLEIEAEGSGQWYTHILARKTA